MTKYTFLLFYEYMIDLKNKSYIVHLEKYERFPRWTLSNPNSSICRGRVCGLSCCDGDTLVNDSATQTTSLYMRSQMKPKQTAHAIKDWTISCKHYQRFYTIRVLISLTSMQRRDRHPAARMKAEFILHAPASSLGCVHQIWQSRCWRKFAWHLFAWRCAQHFL